jgi:hypothetical protein
MKRVVFVVCALALLIGVPSVFATLSSGKPIFSSGATIRVLPPTSPSNFVVASLPITSYEVETVRDWHIEFKLIVKEARIAYGQGERSRLSVFQPKLNALWKAPETWAERNPRLKPAALNCDHAVRIATEGLDALRQRNPDGLNQLNAAVARSEQCYTMVVRP